MAVISKLQTGKIYKITSPHTKLVYIGSTNGYLDVRFLKHQLDYVTYTHDQKKYVSSYEILKFGDAKIELLEDVDANTNLFTREQYWMDVYDCVNKKNAIAAPGTYHAKYSEKRNAKRRVPVECECGNFVSPGNKFRHVKSGLHIRTMEMKTA